MNIEKRLTCYLVIQNKFQVYTFSLIDIIILKVLYLILLEKIFLNILCKNTFNTYLIYFLNYSYIFKY